MSRVVGSVPRAIVAVGLVFFMGWGPVAPRSGGGQRERVAGSRLRPLPSALVIRRVYRTVVYVVSISYKNGK